MALTEVDICNLAQEKLGADHIGSIVAPAGTAAKRYALIYPQYRDVELRRRRWRFAMVEQAPLTLLAKRTTDDNYPFRYGLPVKCLRPVRDKFSTWKQVGNEIWARGNGTLKVDYIRSDLEPAQFDVNFVDVLACRLALEAVEKVTQSAAKAERLKALYDEAVLAAKQVNAFIVGPEDIGSDDSEFSWLTERYY